MPYCLATAWDKYRGYAWYDQLLTLTEVSFEIQFGDRSLSLEQASRSEGEGRPDTIAVIPTIAYPDGRIETTSFITDVAFYADEGFHWSYMDDASIFVTKSSTIDADDLVELLERSFFYPSDDSSADSWTTQAEDFREEASARAHKILSCEEVARQECIRLVVDRHLRWLLPRDRETAIRIMADGGVAVEFRE